jgi:hypothetical protein
MCGEQGGICDQFGGHGETVAVGMEVDDVNFDADPFCDIATTVEGAGGNDGRGDIRGAESFEGDALSEDGPPILQQ